MPSTRTAKAAPRPGQLATLEVGSERASLHPRTLRRAIAAGELTGYKFGRALRIDLDELDAWITSKAVPNARSGPPRTPRPDPLDSVPYRHLTRGQNPTMQTGVRQARKPELSELAENLDTLAGRDA